MRGSMRRVYASVVYSPREGLRRASGAERSRIDVGSRGEGGGMGDVAIRTIWTSAGPLLAPLRPPSGPPLAPLWPPSGAKGYAVPCGLLWAYEREWSGVVRVP